jgi:transposase
METDPKKLAELGGERLQCTEEQLVDALTGRAQPVHGEMLALQLQRLQLIDQQMARLNRMIAAAMKAHQDAVIRLAEVPGLGVDSAQQIIAEVGAQASTFPSAERLSRGPNRRSRPFAPSARPPCSPQHNRTPRPPPSEAHARRAAPRSAPRLR